MTTVNNFDEIINETLTYAKNNDINKILVFSRGIDNVLKIKELIEEDFEGINLICVTFPMNQEYLTRDEDGDVVKMDIDLHDEKNIEVLNKNDIRLISGMMPFSDIVTKSSDVNIHSLISESLTIVHKALPLAVQAILMATDNGSVMPGEQVISMVNAISIHANGTNSNHLFHPKYGFVLEEIIAKRKVD